jgi:2-keto-3-deoxy-L-rhamnonate aldolase RhmA
MQYLFRQRGKDKMLCFGTIVGIPSPETAEVLSLVGFDWMDVKSVNPKGSLLFDVREMRWNF